jgi:hypothetical protein
MFWFGNGGFWHQSINDFTDGIGSELIMGVSYYQGHSYSPLIAGATGAHLSINLS